MMQQVATSKADIAAFAANTPQGGQQDSSFSKDFGQYLQQHQDAQAPAQGAKISSNKTAQQTDKAAVENVKQTQKNSVNAAPDKSNNSASELEQTTAVKGDNKTPEQVQANAKNVEGGSSTLKPEGSAVVVKEEQNIKLGDNHHCAGGCGEASADSDAQIARDKELAEQVLADINELVRQFELTSISSQDIETNSEKLSVTDTLKLEEPQVAQNKSQDWPSLVNKLHTLASSDGEDVKIMSAEDIQILDVDAANLVQQSIGNKVNSPEELAANMLNIQVGAEKTSANIEVKTPQFLANIVTEILSGIDTSQLTGNHSETEVQIEAIVNQLAALQGAFDTSKTANTLDQVAGSNSKLVKEQHTVQDTNVGTMSARQVLNSLQSSELELSKEQLTEPLNKSLVALVLSPDTAVKESENLDTLKPKAIALEQGASVINSQAEGVLAEEQTLLQDNIPALIRDKAPTSNKALEILAGMSPEKLDKSLNNLLQRLSSEQSNGETQNAQLKEQQTTTVAVSQIVLPVFEQANKDFVAALKAGVDEFKAQLAQGREPGIDLKSLVTDVMSKSAETSSPLGKHAEQVEIAVKGFSQILDFAQQLNGTLEQHQVSTLSQNNYMAREVGQSQFDQLKQFQAQSSQFDKAVNISKPEGAQQLAEKVRWMVNAKQLVAEIRLDPAELGSMQVKVSVTGESANISFVVQSQQARDAMENATPKLREMLAEKGIELGQSSVEQEQGENGDKDQLAGQQNNGAHQGTDDANESMNETIIQQPIVNGALGGIDYFV